MQADHLSTPSRLRPRKSKSTSKYSNYISDDEDKTENETKIKPTHLFSENDINGKQMFMFKSYKKRYSMANKAALALTPSKDLQITRLEEYPQENHKAKILSECAKTPHSIRSRLKKGEV